MSGFTTETRGIRHSFNGTHDMHKLIPIKNYWKWADTNDPLGRRGIISFRWEGAGDSEDRRGDGFRGYRQPQDLLTDCMVSSLQGLIDKVDKG